MNTASLRKDFPAELFDLPHTGRRMSMFLAIGYATRRNAAQIKDRKKRAVRVEVWVQASTSRIAERVGGKELRDVHRCKLAALVPHTWPEYAKVLARAGFTVTPDPFPTK